MSHRDEDQLDLLGRCHSKRIDVRVHILDAGTELTYQPAQWNDTIVEIAAGTIELKTRAGTHVEFKTGDILWLTGLPVRALHNRGTVPAVLVTATRHPTGITGASPPPDPQPARPTRSELHQPERTAHASKHQRL